MTDMDGTDGVTRKELVERVALMEAMIAEGRQATQHYGWTFVLWGLVYFAATGWMCCLPHGNLAWAVCVTVGWVVTLAGRRRQSARGVQGPRSRTIGAVWMMSGTALSLFGFLAGISHQAQHNFALYLAAMLFFVGLAHAISAAILRWVAQGVVAAIWWGSGIAILFASSPERMLGIFLTATFFGQIVFGLYVMLLERRRAPAQVLRHG